MSFAERLPQPELDDRDQAILAQRRAVLNHYKGVRVGDFVRFADGVVRRVAHIWRDEDGIDFSIQTSNGGSYYLGTGYVSMSGSLYDGIKPWVLTRTDELREGSVWFFHHDLAGAGRGVNATMEFRVYQASVPTEREYCRDCDEMVPGTHKGLRECPSFHKYGRTP